MYLLSMSSCRNCMFLAIIVFVYFFHLQAFPVFAASQGPLYAGTVSNFNDGGTTPWSNPANAQGNNTSTAATSSPPMEWDTTQRLRATNFGFTIPEGSTIDGVMTEIEYTANANNRFRDISNMLLVNGVEAGDEHSIGANWTTTKVFAPLGGADDVWGAQLTPEIVNASNFGISIKGERYHRQAVAGSVFRMRMTIFYTAPVNQSPEVILHSPENFATNLGTQPTFEFTGVDQENNDLLYEIEIINAASEVIVLAHSATDPGFSNLDTVTDSSPFQSNDRIQYAVQADDALSVGAYSWRVRALDPAGSNIWGEWSESREYEVGIPLVSISITSDGVIAYGTVSAGVSQDTIMLEDTQTAENDGNVPVDVNIKSSAPVGWAIGVVPGLDVFVHEFSVNGGINWVPLTTADSYQTLAENIATNSFFNFDMRLTVPDPSTITTEQHFTITIQAVQR